MGLEQSNVKIRTSAANQFDITEIKRRADIQDVWAALGGGRLRRNRGQAWWRDGNGYSVSLDADRGLWHDFVTGDGGDVFALVQAVRQCGFRAAIKWLAGHTGVVPGAGSPRRERDGDSDWSCDLRRARWWSIAAEALAEWRLEDLSSYDLQRRGLTQVIGAIRLGDASLVAEYRLWRRHDPELTAAMCRAGRQHEARIQSRLADWLGDSYGQTTP